MEQAVEKFLVAVNERIQFMWKGKYHMEVGGVNDFRSAFIHPDFFQDSLAFGTDAAAAGIIVHFQVSAFRTPADIASKPAGFAV